MATMVLPFDAVQESVTFVTSGVGIAERMHAMRRFVSKAMLTPAYHDVVNEQRELIVLLEKGLAQQFESDELISIADKLDSLVVNTERLIKRARTVDFPMWNGYLRAMAKYSEKLDSLSETFRLSASERHVQYVDDLLASATETSGSEGNWRDFVASLHD